MYWSPNGESVETDRGLVVFISKWSPGKFSQHLNGCLDFLSINCSGSCLVSSFAIKIDLFCVGLLSVYAQISYKIILID